MVKSYNIVSYHSPRRKASADLLSKLGNDNTPGLVNKNGLILLYAASDPLIRRPCLGLLDAVHAVCCISAAYVFRGQGDRCRCHLGRGETVGFKMRVGEERIGGEHDAWVV